MIFFCMSAHKPLFATRLCAFCPVSSASACMLRFSELCVQCSARLWVSVHFASVCCSSECCASVFFSVLCLSSLCICVLCFHCAVLLFFASVCVPVLWGSFVDFLNQRREGGMVFYQVFLLSPSQCAAWTVETIRGCVSLKKYKSQGKAAEVTVNSKEENS